MMPHGHPQPIFLRLGLLAQARSQTQAGAEEAGGLAPGDVQRLSFTDVGVPQLSELNQLTLHHDLCELDEDIEDTKVALSQRQAKGLHVEPVASEHRERIPPATVCGRTAATRV